VTLIHVEFNTIITALGMMCVTVQGTTGLWAVYGQRKPALLKTNPIISRSHSTFGAFATCLYLLGLFSGLVGLIGAMTIGKPPLELDSASFNIHTWGSFPALLFIAWKTWLSYFNKPALFRGRLWLGPAALLSWVFTWISAAISYYLRTQPDNLQHPPPVFLFPYELMWLQLILPFALGGFIGWVTLRQVRKT
jgi:hypothetical protein